jgi:hypothetical protein
MTTPYSFRLGRSTCQPVNPPASYSAMPYFAGDSAMRATATSFGT